jgi:branched-chain amino acid transport system substrate-binding protein
MQNGVQQAVDDINAAGGIGGRKIELIAEDDLGTPEGAQAAENKLIDAGVTAVIGHFTSNQTLEGLKVTAQRGIVLVSATASTSQLSGKKDLFFRTVVSTDRLGRSFGRYVFESRHLRRVAIVYDEDNSSYAVPLAQAFRQQFLDLGGSITAEVKFSGAAVVDFNFLVPAVQAAGPDGVLLITNPTQTALAAQVIRLANWDVPLFASSWAQADALLQNGGKSVEGLEVVISIGTYSPNPGMTAFTAAYEKNYNRKPGIFAIEGYDTMQYLASALRKTGGKQAGLPEALASIPRLSGLTSDIRFDEFGDAVRNLFVLRVQSSTFQAVRQLDYDE